MTQSLEKSISGSNELVRLTQFSNEGIDKPFDVCYTAHSSCLNHSVNYHPMEDYEVFMRVFPNGLVEGEVRTRYHQRDTFSMSFRETEEVKNRTIVKDVRGSQLWLVLNKLGLDFEQFVEEAYYGRERTELRRIIEKMQKDWPIEKEDLGKLAETNLMLGQEEKNGKILFMFRNYYDVFGDLYREFFFTPEGNSGSYSTINPIFSFHPSGWMHPSREDINASLKSAVESMKSKLFNSYKWDEFKSFDTSKLTASDKTCMLHKINEKLKKKK